MQISTIKNPNFEKPYRNPSNRTQVNILKKKNYWISLQKIRFRICSVTAKMYELRNSGKKGMKRSDIFVEKLPRDIRNWFSSKNQFKIISCLCTFKWTVSWDFRPLVFFMNQFPPSPWVHRYGRFKFFQKFAKIFKAQGLTLVANAENLQS